MRRTLPIFAAWLIACSGVTLAISAAGRTTQAGAETAATFPVTIRVDAAARKGPLPPIWRFFGADEPNYAYAKNGQKLIAQLGALAPKRVYFRAHNLLTTGDGTPALKWGSTNAYTEDAHGRPVYDWTIVDRIFDTYLARGVRPYVQIGFMPQALSVKPEPYKHSWSPTAKYDEIFTGWAYPPTDYDKWRGLVQAWVTHAVKKYGKAEVAHWYFEVWNEANIGYWRGTPEEFQKLYDYAADGVRRALPTAKVGGPETAGSGGAFSRAFFHHVLDGRNEATGGTGSPLDFIAFHAKGKPEFVDGHVRMGIATQLSVIDEGFRMVSAVPEIKTLPIVIGESDPDGCAACQGPQLGYRNSTMYSSYTAASVARIYDLADRHDVRIEGALTWAFEFEDQPFFAGFRALATNGIPLPVLNVFRIFSRMASERIAATSDRAVTLDAILAKGVRADVDVGALAARDGHKVTVLVWHYHDDDVAGPDAAVTLELDHLALRNGRARIRHDRIDEAHSNAYAAWQRMGSPATPAPGQYAELERASQLATVDAPATVPIQNGRATMTFRLPRQGVSLITLSW